MVSITTSVNNRIGFTSSCKEQGINERKDASNMASSNSNKGLNENKMSVPIAFERNYYMQKMWAKCVRLIKEILKIIYFS